MSWAMKNALCVTPHGGRTDANKWTYLTEEVGRQGFPPFLLYVRGNRVLGQVEAKNNVAGTARNLAQQKTSVKSLIGLFINHDQAFYS